MHAMTPAEEERKKKKKNNNNNNNLQTQTGIRCDTTHKQ
jgi:hypothetical protein